MRGGERADGGFRVAGREANVRRFAVSALAAAIVLAVAIVQSPNLRGFWGRDDFAQLAMVRMIGSPWPLFTHDHFVVPHSIFRPLGYVSLWLCARLFGEAYAPHAAFDTGLHIATALLLWRFLIRASVRPAVAAAVALLFALHPAITGTSLWWSARFDLLATFFIMLSLLAALRVCDRPSIARIAGACVAAMAAMLSKEIGTLAVVAISILWLQRAAVDRSFRRGAFVAVTCAWLTAAIFFVWRAAILGTFSSSVTGVLPLSQAIWRGIGDWFVQAPGYLTFWPHLQAWQRGALAASLVVALGALIARAAAGTNERLATGQRMPAALVGIALFTLPIFVQAPIAAFASPLGTGMSAIEAGMQSRLYYLQLLGAAIILAPVLGYVYTCRRNWVRRSMTAGLVVALTVFATASYQDASAFAQRSSAIAVPARAAVAAVAPMTSPNAACHVAFLDYAPPPEWDVFVSMDAVVKALTPDLRRVRYCWFYSDVKTWVHLQAAPVAIADAQPFAPAVKGAQPIAWRRLGKLVFAYLAPLASTQHPNVSQMRFLQFRNGKIVDVTADAIAGGLNYVLY